MDNFFIQFLRRKDSLVLSVGSIVGTTACAAAYASRSSITFADDTHFKFVVDRLCQAKVLLEDEEHEYVSSSKPLRLLNDEEFTREVETGVKKRCMIELKKRERDASMNNSSSKKPRNEHACTLNTNSLSQTSDTVSSPSEREMEDVAMAVQEADNTHDSDHETQADE